MPLQAFEVLGGIESQIKNLKTQTMSLPELAKKHEELLRTIKDSSMEPIQRGQLMLQKSHLHRSVLVRSVWFVVVI